MKQIVIIGGGFAGIAAAKILVKKLDSRNARVTVIDKNSFHTFSSSLYEVATSEEPKKNVAIALHAIFSRSVHRIKALVTEINPTEQYVVLDTKEKVPYDYLIVAIGSQAAYYHIPGLLQYGLPLKSVQDALTIREAIKEKFHKQHEKGEKLRIMVGGGGFAGTELVAELIEYRKRLTRHPSIKDDSVEISVLQGSDRVLNELDPRVSDIATKRLSEGGIIFCFGGHISEVTKDTVKTDDGKSYPYDVLIWTGGVNVSDLLQKSGFETAHNGSILVNEFLQAQGFPTVFVAGDAAGYLDPKTQKPIPQVAQVAEDEGETVGRNVWAAFVGKPLKPYKYRHIGYFIPLRGKYAVAALHDLVMSGFDVWVMQQLVFLRYFLRVLPKWKAFKRFNTFEEALLK